MIREQLISDCVRLGDFAVKSVETMKAKDEKGVVRLYAGASQANVLMMLTELVSFYLRYVLPKKESIKQGFYKYGSLDRLPGWNAVMGLQFENLVLNNIATLAPLIGLAGKNVESAAPYFRSGRKTGEGVQVDYLVQLPRCTYIVEIKRKNRIGKAIEDEVQQKLERLKLPRNRSVKLVLVYDCDLDPAVEEDGYFDYLIPVEMLLRP